MTTRTLVYEDAVTRIWEVFDEGGVIVGVDQQFIGAAGSGDTTEASASVMDGNVELSQL